MEYDFRKIEKKWQSYWSSHRTFKAVEDTSKPKYYVLDMFPYPSGAGLHVLPNSMPYRQDSILP